MQSDLRQLQPRTCAAVGSDAEPCAPPTSVVSSPPTPPASPARPARAPKAPLGGATTWIFSAKALGFRLRMDWIASARRPSDALVLRHSTQPQSAWQ